MAAQKYSLDWNENYFLRNSTKRSEASENTKLIDAITYLELEIFLVY
jgi:hypothetical protein